MSVAAISPRALETRNAGPPQGGRFFSEAASIYSVPLAFLAFRPCVISMPSIMPAMDCPSRAQESLRSLAAAVAITRRFGGIDRAFGLS